MEWFQKHDRYVSAGIEKGREQNCEWRREWRSDVFPYLCGFHTIHSCSKNGNGRDALNPANCLGIRGILRGYAISCWIQMQIVALC